MDLIGLIFTLPDNLFEFSEKVFNYYLLNSLTHFFCKKVTRT